MTSTLSRSIFPLLLIVAVVTALTAACGSDANDDSAQTSEAQVLAEAVCSRGEEVCPGTDTKAACVESISGTLTTLFTLPGVEVIPSALATCKQTIASLSADDVKAYGGKPPVLGVCAPFTKGTLANGQSCASTDLLSSVFGDERCESGVCADGVCAEPAAKGQACSIGGCAAGLTCSIGVCEEPVVIGEDCSQKGLCTDGLKCFDDGQGTMRCQTPRPIAVGEPCAADGVCALGDSQCFCAADNTGCVQGVCGRTSYCKP
jgi:hypothetical protein